MKFSRSTIFLLMALILSLWMMLLSCAPTFKKDSIWNSDPSQATATGTADSGESAATPPRQAAKPSTKAPPRPAVSADPEDGPIDTDL